MTWHGRYVVCHGMIGHGMVGVWYSMGMVWYGMSGVWHGMIGVW